MAPAPQPGARRAQPASSHLHADWAVTSPRTSYLGEVQLGGRPISTTLNRVTGGCIPKGLLTVQSGHIQQDASRGVAPTVSMSRADVGRLLASQPTPAMPDHLAARVTDAIAAESARRRGGGRGGPGTGSQLPASASAPTLPQPRSGKTWSRFETLVPRQRLAHSAA